jgi:hypothetical protein
MVSGMDTSGSAPGSQSSLIRKNQDLGSLGMIGGAGPLALTFTQTQSQSQLQLQQHHGGRPLPTTTITAELEDLLRTVDSKRRSLQLRPAHGSALSNYQSVGSGDSAQFASSGSDVSQIRRAPRGKVKTEMLQSVVHFLTIFVYC